MDLGFQAARADVFKGQTQRIKILSEHWVGQEVYCPNCGRREMHQYPPNRPVADFLCTGCNEQYELKSQGRLFGTTVSNGAYRTMIDRLNCSTNPNLLLLHYDPLLLSVINLLVIPKYFFIPGMTEKRNALSITARRAGWVGCNISLRGVPEAGRISLIASGVAIPKERVLAQWRQTKFLEDRKGIGSKGWLLCVMKCIDELQSQSFTLEQCYQFEDQIRALYPSNQHIKAKIRQQLQILRDQGFLEFVGRGRYKVVNAARLA